MLFLVDNIIEKFYFVILTFSPLISFDSDTDVAVKYIYDGRVNLVSISPISGFGIVKNNPKSRLPSLIFTFLKFSLIPCFSHKNVVTFSNA